MTPYTRLIETFCQTQIPLSTNQRVRFEAIVAAILGTKQRRYGPLPAPETQVKIRDVVRNATGSIYKSDATMSGSNNKITFYLPWGARKQDDNQGIDILEFMALRQLLCLKKELEMQGIESLFRFRLEDLGDRWLFENRGLLQIEHYVASFIKLSRAVLGDSADPSTETMFTNWTRFSELAKAYQPTFYRYLTSGMIRESKLLVDMGWRGDIPQEQRDYYLAHYHQLWPTKSDDELIVELSRYFASTLARVNTKATAKPDGPVIDIAFAHPIPGDPLLRARVHYRTLPERYSNNHRSPWMGKGYLQIDEQNNVTPKIAFGNDLRLIKDSITLAEVTIETDYVLV